MQIIHIFGIILGVAAVASPHAAFRRVKYEDPNHGVVPGKFPRTLAREEDSPVTPQEPGSHPPIMPAIDIFPPKWHPGSVLKKTDSASISEALDDVMRAGDMLHDRRCAIGIANEGQATLKNPEWAFYSGQISAAMPSSVEFGQTSLNLFVKRKGLASGTVGILSYDINGTDYKVVVLWSVPFDFNIYDVWFNMKVYPKRVETNKDLYKHMYYNAGPWRTGGYEAREEFGVKMRATMTDNYHSKLIVWINSDAFDANGSYDLHTDCSYHPGRVGNYCTQECFASGWCWVDKGCSTKKDCAGRHTCPNGC